MKQHMVALIMLYSFNSIAMESNLSLTKKIRQCNEDLSTTRSVKKQTSIKKMRSILRDYQQQGQAQFSWCFLRTGWDFLFFDTQAKQILSASVQGGLIKEAIITLKLSMRKRLPYNIFGLSSSDITYEDTETIVRTYRHDETDGWSSTDVTCNPFPAWFSSGIKEKKSVILAQQESLLIKKQIIPTLWEPSIMGLLAAARILNEKSTQWPDITDPKYKYRFKLDGQSANWRSLEVETLRSIADRKHTKMRLERSPRTTSSLADNWEAYS